jgi:carboxymethylenebutenolidase
MQPAIPQEETANIHTEDGPLPAFLARPTAARNGRITAVLLAQEAFGVNQQMRELSRRFAHEGFLAIAPEFYHRDGGGITIPYDEFPRATAHMAALKDEAVTGDIAATLAYLEERFSIPSSQVAIIGHCLGGRIAMLAACAGLPLAMAIAYYGGGMVEAKPEFGYTPLLARFPHINCPVKLLFGGKDASIPPAHVEKIREALQAAEKDYEILLYPEAGHAFANDDRPDRYHEASAKDAWAKTLGWLIDW